MSESPIRFKLDGAEVEAQPGETIWQVAQRLGTEIPHLCHLPEPGYRPDGNCRACMVEIAGERVLAASCIRTPRAGMEVTTASARAPVTAVDSSASTCRRGSMPMPAACKEARSRSRSFSRSIVKRQASKASPRWAAAATTTTRWASRASA